MNKAGYNISKVKCGWQAEDAGSTMVCLCKGKTIKGKHLRRADRAGMAEP